MRLNINGDPREIPEGSRVKDLLELLGFPTGRGVAIAVDGEIVRRDEWERMELRPGQRVEVVRAVQGG